MAMGHGHSDPAVTCLYYNIWKDLIVVFFFQYKIDWKYVPKYLKPKYCWYEKAVLICVTTHDRRIFLLCSPRVAKSIAESVDMPDAYKHQEQTNFLKVFKLKTFTRTVTFTVIWNL